MKNLITLFVAVCIAGWTFAQSPLKVVRERVGNPEILKNWDMGELKSFNNVEVVRTEGSNAIDYRTNVLYTANGNYLEEAPGGQLSIFYDRNDEKLAAPGLFTVKLLDSDGNEIYQECLGSDKNPYYYKWDIWYYFETINIPVLVSKTFTVRVQDDGLNQEFEFVVTIQQDSEFMPQQLLSSAKQLLY